MEERRIAKIACADYFYEYVESNGKPVSLEGLFQQIENDCMPAMRDVVAAQSFAEMQRQRQRLALYVASQLMRTLAFRIFQEQVWRLVYDIDVREGDTGLEPNEALVKLVHGRFVQDYLMPATAILVQKRWLLLHNATGTPFYTSDNPAVMFARDPSVLDGITGLEVPNVRIYLPLDPRTALLLADRSEVLIERSDILMDSRAIDAFNRQQVKASDRWVFSKTCDFSTAQELLAREPELARRHRDRVRKVS